MTKRLAMVLRVALLLLAGAATPSAQVAVLAPVLVVETTKGTFEIETYPDEAPKTVAHVLALAKDGFYDGIRVHRALPGFVAQFGDPQTRDVGLRDQWGKGPAASSGKPVGVAEINRKRPHRKGAVGLAHIGEPTKADSQIYIMLAPHAELTGKYALWGQVVTGEDVPERLQVGDTIIRMYAKPSSAPR